MELSLLCGANVLLIIEDIETSKREVYSNNADIKALINSLALNSSPPYTNKDVSLLSDV